MCFGILCGVPWTQTCFADIMVIFDENYFRKIVTSDLSEYEEMIRLREKQEDFLEEQVRGEVTGHKFSKK